jgi:hypothetical protein
MPSSVSPFCRATDNDARIPLLQQLRQPHQIVGGGRECEGLADAIASSKLGLLLSGDHLGPTEGFFDSLADALANGIASVARRAAIDRRRASLVFCATCGVTFIERNSLSLGISSPVEALLKPPSRRARRVSPVRDFYGRFSEHLYCNIHVPRGLG